MKKASHVFICFTPLHTIIANAIIKQENIEDALLIFYFHDDTTKMRYYYNKVAVNAKYGYYLPKKNSIFNFVRLIYIFLFKIKRNVHANGTLYSANIKSMYTRIIFKIFKIKQVITFDDGIGNINKNSYFTKKIVPNNRDKILDFLGWDISYSKLFALAKKNYTIYKDFENIMPNSEYISVFNFNNNKSNHIKSNRETSIFLSSTFSEEEQMTEDEEIRLFESIINKYNIKYVIPHPLTSKNKLKFLKDQLIDNDLVAEEAILALNNDYDQINVYGFYSSALIHLHGLRGINCINIKLQNLKHYDISHLDNIFERSNITNLTI